MELPTVSEFSERYRTEDTSHLAPTTRNDLDSYLREGGPLLALVDEVRRLRARPLTGKIEVPGMTPGIVETRPANG